MAYNPLSAAGAPGRTRINLNKRVAYPLQGSVTSTPTTKPTAVVLPNQLATTPTTKPTAVVLPNQVATAGPLPPPPPTATILPPIPTQSGQQQDNINLPADALAVSFRSLRERVPLVQESVNVRREEIERRLGIIEQLWQSGNLSEAVKQKIYNLSLAVQRSAHSEAMEIYTSLVANHANECTSWAVTLRHIVLTITSSQTPSAASVPGVGAFTAAATPVGSDINLQGPSGVAGSTSTNLPTMSVMAMPRSSTNNNSDVQGGGGGGGGNDAINNAAAPISRVQHI